MSERRAQRPGTFDPPTSRVEVAADGDDLLDLAATATMLNGGSVYVVDASELPADVPLAAIYRY